LDRVKSRTSVTIELKVTAEQHKVKSYRERRMVEIARGTMTTKHFSPNQVRVG
jgi:hypothetical protein